MSVDNRLLKIAGMIRQGDRVADIGTDHAYLPVFLIKEKLASTVYACDVSDGPLFNARTNIERSGVEGITLRKGDGLGAVAPDEVDTVVIAGMGGDLIARIIADAEWVKNERYELILQPMTAVEDLREFLCKNGFSILKENAVSAHDRIYTAMKVVYTGRVTECDPLFYYVGRLSENLGTEEITYIARKRRIIAKLAEDISVVEDKKDMYDMLCAALRGIDRLLEK